MGRPPPQWEQHSQERVAPSLQINDLPMLPLAHRFGSEARSPSALRHLFVGNRHALLETSNGAQTRADRYRQPRGYQSRSSLPKRGSGPRRNAAPLSRLVFTAGRSVQRSPAVFSWVSMREKSWSRTGASAPAFLVSCSTGSCCAEAAGGQGVALRRDAPIQVGPYDPLSQVRVVAGCEMSRTNEGVNRQASFQEVRERTDKKLRQDWITLPDQWQSTAQVDN